MMPRTADVFRQFLLQGFTSFGGTVAHLGYFHKRFVKRRSSLGDVAPTPVLWRCVSFCRVQTAVRWPSAWG